MKFFIDSADLDEIRDLAATGLVDGVTTNPSLISKQGARMVDAIAEICAVVAGPVSAEVTATECDAMVAEARRDPAWAVLGSIPFFGPVRIALILAIMRTPWRFRTKRNLWAYCGLAVVTHSSSDYELVNGQVVRKRRAPMTRGLNRNYN